MEALQKRAILDSIPTKPSKFHPGGRCERAEQMLTALAGINHAGGLLQSGLFP
jgi:hypothetical protein